MIKVKTIRTIVYPARDLEAAIGAWSNILGSPVYQHRDFATFVGEDGIDIRLSRLPWTDHQLVFWEVEDLKKAHESMLEDGAIAMGEVEGGKLDEVGKRPIVNGDPDTGIIEVPGRKLAVVMLADGTLVGLLQDLQHS